MSGSTRPPPTPEAVLRRLEWTVIRRLDGVLHGDYRTLFRGYGLDLADLREYVYGDDVRHIDWNVTARLQTPYVREYNEEREVAAWFLLDLSASVDFGSQQINKQAVSTEFVSVLARILTRHGNRVGALFYGNSVDTVIPARTGRRQVLHLLHKMMTRPSRGEGPATNLQELLQTAYRVAPRRSLVFVVSDFISRPGWEPTLARLAERHDVVAVRLYDPLEMEIPDLGLIVVQDAETGEQLFVDTNDRGFRERFETAAKRREAVIANRSAITNRLRSPIRHLTSNMRASSSLINQRLSNQKLVGAGLPTPAAVVGWLGAVQAQDYPGAKWAIGLRSPSLTDAAVEAAFNDGRILRTHVLRPTWHFVTPADIRWILSLSAPNVHRASASVYRRCECDPRLFGRCHRVLERALEGHQSPDESNRSGSREAPDLGNRPSARLHRDARRARGPDLQRPAPWQGVHVRPAGRTRARRPRPSARGGAR